MKDAARAHGAKNKNVFYIASNHLPTFYIHPLTLKRIVYLFTVSHYPLPYSVFF